MRRIVVGAVFFALLVGVWHAMAVSGRWSPVLLPAPADVGRYLWGAALDGTLLLAAYVTAKRLLLGYLIGMALGLPLGFITARSRAMSDTLGVVALGMQ